MDSLIQDLRNGARILIKKPGFAAAAIIILALGIGANSAIFSAINAILLRPLPYDKPDQLVWIWASNPVSNIGQEAASFPDFVDWRGQSQSFEDMASFGPWLPILTGQGEPERLPCGMVSASLFPLLRVEAEWAVPFLSKKISPARVVWFCSAIISGSAASAWTETSSGSQ